jgi:hypothetical protein
MNHPHIDPPGDPDFGKTEDILRSVRVEPTPYELDRALTTARKRVVGAPVRHSNGGFMRSKVAIISILVMGFVTSGAGATLAFEGSSGNTNASTAEYVPGGNVGGVNANSQANTGTQSDAQASRQVAASSSGKNGKLPFTGLAAIPLIVVGLGLLTVGVTLRRRTPRDNA